MRALQLYFRLHRPYALQVPDGVETSYFGGEADFREANRTEYQPLFALMERNSQKFPEICFSLSVSGLWLEQAERFDPELIRRLKRLVNLGKVELLMQPYDYSLAFFYDKDEFEAQIELTKQKFAQLFGAEPKVLAMPELIYNDKIAKWAEAQGFSGVLAGAMESVLDYRDPNQIFEAAGCEKLKVICQNSRFSEAIRRARDLVLVEQTAPKTALEAPDLPLPEAKKPTRHMTAQDFISGMSGLKTASEAKIEPARVAKTNGFMVFSASKCQKVLEIEALRGNFISLALDPAIFRVYQSMGIVRFFDELIAGWLNKPGNRFLSASGMIEAAQVRHEVAVKITVDWRGAHHSVRKPQGSGLARLDDVRYCPPDWLRASVQVELSKRLYGFRREIAKVRDKDLYREFQKLTALDYIAAIGGKTPVLVDKGLEIVDPVASKQEQQRLTKIWDDLARRILEKMPKPPKITAKSGEKVVPPRVNDQFEVKVTRVAGKKRTKGFADGVAEQMRAVGVATTANSKKTTEQPQEVDWDDLIWDDDVYKALDDAEEALDYVETDNDGPQMTYDEAEDIVDAELAMLEERMMRKKSVAETELKDLIEAELVAESNAKAKRTRRKIVFE